jgi:hypothetical protein
MSFMQFIVLFEACYLEFIYPARLCVTQPLRLDPYIEPQNEPSAEGFYTISSLLSSMIKV